ncbi:hypothetical protein ACLOJK_006607 [Asimina triloba]
MLERESTNGVAEEWLGIVLSGSEGRFLLGDLSCYCHRMVLLLCLAAHCHRRSHPLLIHLSVTLTLESFSSSPRLSAVTAQRKYLVWVLTKQIGS